MANQRSSEVVIRQGFPAIWTAIINYVRVSFDGTRCIENQTSQIVRRSDSSLCNGITPLNPTTSNMTDFGHRRMIRAVLSINWQNNITNEDDYTKSGHLPFSQAVQERRLRLIDHSLWLHCRSITPLGSILQKICVGFTVWRGQGRLCSSAKDLHKGLNAID